MEMEWNVGFKFNICKFIVFVLIIYLFVYYGFVLIVDKYYLV